MDGSTDVDDRWGMYTPAGERLLTTKMDALIEDMRSGFMTRHSLEPRRTAIMRQLKFAGHPEVYDTSVREAIYAVIDAECDALGWHRIDE